MSRTLLSALRRLRDADNQQLAASELTPGQRRALDEFRIRTGAVRQQRQGRGLIYRITNPVVIEQHYTELVPMESEAIDADLPIRSANIARTRSSKSGQHTHDRAYLLLKGTEGAHWVRDDGESYALDEHTQILGAGALTMGQGIQDDWTTSGELWLVENQAVFDRLDWLPSDNIASVAWYRGQLQNALIDWLAARQRASRIVFFPDYDGVGLQNYLKLKRRLKSQASFWFMPDWELKLQRLGSNDLWNKTVSEFKSVLAQIEQNMCAVEPALMNLIRHMQRNGVALEQEAVFIRVASDPRCSQSVSKK